MKKKIDHLPNKISVFPLSNFIIFPRTTVPLNIFEPRYIDMVDITLNLSNKVQKEELMEFLEKKCNNNCYVKVNKESLISLDYEQEESSAIIDMQWINVCGNTVKIILWYDNEWGYSARVLDLVKKLGETSE